MKRRFATLCAVVATLCLDSSAQTIETNQVDLPIEAIEAIEQTPCPRAAGVSVEACLLWLTPERGSVDASVVAREVGRAKTDIIGAIVELDADPAPEPDGDGLPRPNLGHPQRE